MSAGPAPTRRFRLPVGLTRWGLRKRVVLAFGVGALFVSVTFAALTYVAASNYLLAQRERSAIRQVAADAAAAREGLNTAGVGFGDILTKLSPPAGTAAVARWRDRWYASSLEAGPAAVPVSVRDEVARGHAVSQRIRTTEGPHLVVGIPVEQADLEFYELVSLDELDSTLRTLSGVLLLVTLVATAAGGGLGLWASRSVLRPLEGVAGTAAHVAAGNLGTRLPPTRDPDLATIAGSFNSMVDTLQQRIERDARFAADVSHELLSPMTTLVAAVDVLDRRSDELSERSRQALALVTEELARFRRMLDNLLDLARAERGLDPDQFTEIDVAGLANRILTTSRRSPSLLDTTESDLLVMGDAINLERVVVNLLDNADQHGGGIERIVVASEPSHVLICVDDRGPAVPPEERDRIFERFATGDGARGSSTGTGLGLALAREITNAHGGAIWCTDSPDSPGTRFVVSLPRAEI